MTDDDDDNWLISG